MARGRFISESVAKDLRLNSLSVEAELVYLMTIPHLDRDGLIEGDPEILLGTVCPKRRQFLDMMDCIIGEWVKAGLVVLYDSQDGDVLWFKGFTKNQQGLRYERETPSKFAPPPGYEHTKTGMKRTDDDDIPSNGDSIRQNAGGVRQNALQEQAQSQVKDQVEVKAQAQGVRTAPAVLSPQDDALDPKALIADLRQRQFMYLDKDATTIAAQLIADYGWERIMEVADSVEAKHRAKIETGDKGISAPLAYMRSILAGSSNGKAQARGVSPPKQSMGEDSVDKFLARVNGKAH